MRPSPTSDAAPSAQDSVPPFSPSWDEGKYFDLWMFVHLLSGVAGGLSNAFIRLSTLQVLGLALALMLLWEIGESAARVRETVSNRIIDIVVGLAGVGVALWVTSRVSPRAATVAFVAVLAVALVGLGAGVRAARRRQSGQHRSAGARGDGGGAVR